MGELDTPSIHLEEEKCRMDEHFFDKGQLLNIQSDDIREEEDAQDVELEGIDLATWEKKNRL